MALIPRWVKFKKQRVCRACGGAPLSDIHRKEATFWCSACERMWKTYRNRFGDIKVRYFR